jgi:uncharacterized DUF497 family protein
MKAPDFEWDDFKNAQNMEKHGVSFYEAQYAFADTKRVIILSLRTWITAGMKIVFSASAR